MNEKKYQYKIVIKGAYGESNFGDDALMLVLFDYLKRIVDPEQIAFICKNASYLSVLIPDAKILTIAEQKKLTSELFIYGGGTQFFSFQSKRTKVRQFISKIKFAIKRLEHKRKFKYTASLGVGVGPFYDKATELSTKKHFKVMDYIAVRDNLSFKYMQDWNIIKVKQFTDICYLLDNQKYIEDPRIEKIYNIGIIVRDWNNTENNLRYYDSISELFIQLKDIGYNPTLIIFSKDSDHYWMNRINEFENILIWEPRNNSMHEFIISLNNFDIFITARFHGAIFSALLNKPFISIIVEDKLDIVAEEYSKASKKWPYPFDVSQCVDFVQELNNNYTESNKYLLDVCLEHKNLAISMKNEFTAFLDAILEKKNL